MLKTALIITTTILNVIDTPLSLFLRNGGKEL